MDKEDNLQVTKKDQVKMVEELIAASSLSKGFYLMLVLSAGVVAFGLILNNVAVIMGGMLITPLLTPVLTLALGVVVADTSLILRSIKIILRSIGIIFGISLVAAFLFPPTEINQEITLRLISNIPYFLVAFLAGLAAAFAWSKKNLSDLLPGVAIAVSLLPPLAIMGIGVANLNMAILRSSFLSFGLNLFGIVLGSVVIFSLLHFYRARKETLKAVKKEVKKEEAKKEIQENNKDIKASKIKKEIKKAIKKELKKEKDKT